MVIFAGNNGSGKSSFRKGIQDELLTSINIDSDAIERRLKSEGVDNPTIKSGRESVQLVNECIDRGISFSVETTLSGSLPLKQIKRAKEKGFRVTLYYLFLSDVNLNVMRVNYRHQQGGHNIPKEDILRRHERSRRNLFKVWNDLDKLMIIDNTGRSAEVVTYIVDGEVIIGSSDFKPTT